MKYINRRFNSLSKHQQMVHIQHSGFLARRIPVFASVSAANVFPLDTFWLISICICHALFSWSMAATGDMKAESSRSSTAFSVAHPSICGSLGVMFSFFTPFEFLGSGSRPSRGWASVSMVLLLLLPLVCLCLIEHGCRLHWKKSLSGPVFWSTNSFWRFRWILNRLKWAECQVSVCICVTDLFRNNKCIRYFQNVWKWRFSKKVMVY